MGQRGQGFGFKKNRLVRMFESEINWLDAYFGERSVTTEDYVQHDNRYNVLELTSRLTSLSESNETGLAN